MCAPTREKGYQYAEQDPSIYHGLSGFDVTTGDTGERSQSFSDVFGKEICDLAEENREHMCHYGCHAGRDGPDGFSGKVSEPFFLTWEFQRSMP